ncbi:MAG: hypothetical protein HY360_09250 [Verrucomicrobia bacterium]|nr:hypothetical protein [Verrucomicrobiota bacterium]
MIDSLKPYAEYKASGQGWLGNVPAHWDLKPGHAAYSKRKVPNKSLKEKTVLLLSYGRIKVHAGDRTMSSSGNETLMDLLNHSLPIGMGHLWDIWDIALPGRVWPLLGLNPH